MSKELNRYRVCRDVAEGRKLSAIAKEYGVDTQRIKSLANEYAELVDEIKADIERYRYPEMWISDKDKRVAEYQRDAERIEEHLRYGWERGLQAEKRALLKMAADELGHLPTRGSAMSDDGTVVNYTIDGIGLDDVT